MANPVNPFIKVIGPNGEEHRCDASERTFSIAGRIFAIERHLAGGGNGDLFRVVELNIGSHTKKLALKLLTKYTETRHDRFLNEIDVLSQLDSPSIFKIIGSDSLQIDGISLPWMIMELGGYNLDIHVQGRPNSNIPAQGPLDLPTLKRVGLQMCDALKCVHDAGFIHRDIKPANFVWSKPFSMEDIAMIDFGLAKPINKDVAGRPYDNLTLDNETVGPRFFLSPELCAYAVDKSTIVDHRSDMWQLARVLWFVATGVVSTGRPSRKLDTTNGPLYELADKMCNDDPADRFQNLAEMRELVAAFPE